MSISSLNVSTYSCLLFRLFPRSRASTSQFCHSCMSSSGNFNRQCTSSKLAKLERLDWSWEHLCPFALLWLFSRGSCEIALWFIPSSDFIFIFAYSGLNLLVVPTLCICSQWESLHLGDSFLLKCRILLIVNFKLWMMFACHLILITNTSDDCKVRCLVLVIVKEL